jgi:hypothetical protein
MTHDDISIFQRTRHLKLFQIVIFIIKSDVFKSTGLVCSVFYAHNYYEVNQS